MSIKLIALDLDGTLVDNTHVNVSERNIRALKKSNDLGIHVVLVSGRSLSLMTDVANTIGCVQYIISANGGLIYDYKYGKVLEKRTIPARDAEFILRTINQYDVPLEVYSGGRMYVDEAKWSLEGFEKQPASFIEARAKANVNTDNLEETLKGKEVEKFNIDNLPKELAQKILSEIGKYQEQLSINYIEIYDNLEISNVDANKGSALKDLCNMLNIDESEVMAFGDSDNDETMLSWAGESYAMSNGVAVAKKAARYTTLSNVEDGVAIAIEKNIINL